MATVLMVVGHTDQGRTRMTFGPSAPIGVILVAISRWYLALTANMRSLFAFLLFVALGYRRETQSPRANRVIQGTWAATPVAHRLPYLAPSLTDRLPLAVFEARCRLVRRTRAKRRRS